MDIKRPQPRQPIPPNAKRVFRGVIFDVYQWEQEMYDGSRTMFEELRRPDTVAVFPILPDGKILLTEQEQPGKKPYVAVAAGRMEEGEDVVTAARRELLEETGYTAEELILWDARCPISKIDWAVYTFVAKGLKRAGDMNLDGGEKVKLSPRTLDELMEIALDETTFFPAEKRIIFKLLEAKYNPEKRQELEELFKP